MTTARTLDPFQQALLDELREVVRDGEPAGSAPPPRWRRPLLVAAGVAVLAGSAVALPAVLGDQPAYAVIQGANGAVDVRVDRLEDAAGLERALEAAGVRADVTYLPVETQCAEGRYVDAVAPDPSADFSFQVSSGQVDRGYEVRLDPGAIGEDQTLVISAARLSDSVGPDGTRLTEGISGSVGIAEGPVAPCDPVPAQS